jgi:SAM-dependent methyltransferase
MKISTNEIFFHRTVKDLFQAGRRILDIGGGLRVDGSRGNVEDVSRAWIKPLLGQVTYEVMDPVPTYHPDMIGDVMAMPCEDASYDAIICHAVLEHVPRPWAAMSEIFRVLKPGGTLFAYVPFLSPYHAMPGYYGDYFRFTEDGIRSLCGDFTHVEVVPVRGPAETLGHLIPSSVVRSTCVRIGRWIDTHRHASGKQAAGYFFTAKKG